MANSVEPPAESSPVFELDYGDSLTGGAKHVGSQQGRIFLRLADGGAFRWIKLRIVSAAVPLRLKYRCLYRPSGGSADCIAEAAEGEQCPPDDAAHIRKIAFESKIYYRCWLAREQQPQAFERDPAGAFWSYNGQFCGTADDESWITAIEIRMPPLVKR